jgi:hypothetical protein
MFASSSGCIFMSRIPSWYFAQGVFALRTFGGKEDPQHQPSVRPHARCALPPQAFANILNHPSNLETTVQLGSNGGGSLWHSSVFGDEFAMMLSRMPTLRGSPGFGLDGHDLVLYLGVQMSLGEGSRDGGEISVVFGVLGCNKQGHRWTKHLRSGPHRSAPDCTWLRGNYAGTWVHWQQHKVEAGAWAWLWGWRRGPTCQCR